MTRFRAPTLPANRRIVTPGTIEEVRRWNYYTRQDDFYKIRDWPYRMQQLGVKARLNNLERMNLLLFWLNNGMEPEVALRWILYQRDFDAEAIRHIRFLINRFTNYNYQYWDMNMQSYRRPADRVRTYLPR